MFGWLKGQLRLGLRSGEDHPEMSWSDVPVLPQRDQPVRRISASASEHHPDHPDRPDYPHPDHQSFSVSGHSTLNEPGVNLGLRAVPISDSLHISLNRFLTAATPRLGLSRSRALTRAEDLLRPLANRSTLQRRELLTLLDASEQLQESSPRDKPGSLNAATEDLIREINRFVGSAYDLQMGVARLAESLEKAASIPVFSDYFAQKYTHLLIIDPVTGKTRLSDEGLLQYAGLKQRFERASRHRHVLKADQGQMTPADRMVGKLVGKNYSDYQRALHKPDGGLDALAVLSTKRFLIESADIVESLASGTPERAKSHCHSTVFPGGMTDPRHLIPGQTYKERGFFRTGDQTPSDKTFRLSVEFAKAYAVDNRSGKAQSASGTSAAKDVQWVTLPGARFRYEGALLEHGQKTYRFIQVAR